MSEQEEIETVSSDKHTSLSPSEATTVDFERPDQLVGQRLDGRFLIEKNLTETGADEGGIGVVYLATDQKLMGKKVVVKILQEAVLKHTDLIRKFLHEKEALIRLDHPGIVRILDSGTLTDGNPFMVMEYIEGHSLRKEIQAKKQLPFDLAAHLIESITDALAAAHSKNILHRDIKPENIMLTPQEFRYDRVRLIDFGIARVGDSQLAPGTEISRAIGTVMYIAPEQLVGSPDLGPTVDIYATAIVVYEMLTGDWPFKPKTIAEMYQIEKDGVKMPPSALRPDLPPVAERIILAALEFEAEKRPQDVRTFGRYLATELRRGRADATDEFYASVGTEWATLPIEYSLPPDSISPATGDPRTATPGQRARPVRRLAIALLLATLALGLPLGYVLWSVPRPAMELPIAAPVSTTERELHYSLTVQKYDRRGKPYDKQFQSTGREIFEQGWKFIMNFDADADGFVYVFTRGKDENENGVTYLLFPSLTVNNGTTQVSAGQRIETKQNTFTGGTGTEIVWLIWSKEQQYNLEAVVRAGFLLPYGAIDETHWTLLQRFLDEHQAQNADPPIRDSENQRTVVKARGDIVVHRIELEHH